MPVPSDLEHRFHPEAEAELVEAIGFYDRESPGLGQRLVEEVEVAIGHILAHPTASTLVTRKGVRRHLLRRFPYSLLYSIEPRQIFIIAVAHQRRRPGYWAKRLKG